MPNQRPNPCRLAMIMLCLGVTSGCARHHHSPPPYTPYHQPVQPAWPQSPPAQPPAPTRAVPAPAPLPPPPPPPAQRAQTVPTRGEPHQRGRASYYHDSLAGNHTANGEIYDIHAMTAAHRTLAFGTVVDVVRPNGRYVRVRINDRGPFAGHNRIIDLSRIAADRLGMIRAGVVDIALYIIEKPAPR